MKKKFILFIAKLLKLDIYFKQTIQPFYKVEEYKVEELVAVDYIVEGMPEEHKRTVLARKFCHYLIDNEELFIVETRKHIDMGLMSDRAQFEISAKLKILSNAKL